MKRPDEITEEERNAIHAKLEELNLLFKEVLGAEGVDVMTVVHAQHSNSEICGGVFIMNSDKLDLKDSYNMLMNALMLNEAALVKQHQECHRPEGTTLN